MSGSRGTCEIRSEDDMCIAVLRGEVDVASVPEIQTAIAAVVGSAPKLVVDLSEVTFFDSSGVHLLDTIVGQAETDGIHVRVVAPEGSRARYVLRICAFREDLVVSSYS